MKKIIVDFADSDNVYLRIKVEKKYIKQLEDIVEKVRTTFEDYNAEDLERAIKQSNLFDKVEFIPLEADLEIYF